MRRLPRITVLSRVRSCALATDSRRRGRLCRVWLASGHTDMRKGFDGQPTARASTASRRPRDVPVCDAARNSFTTSVWRRKRSTVDPRRTSPPILPNLVFGTHSRSRRSSRVRWLAQGTFCGNSPNGLCWNFRKDSIASEVTNTGQKCSQNRIAMLTGRKRQSQSESWRPCSSGLQISD